MSFVPAMRNQSPDCQLAMARDIKVQTNICYEYLSMSFEAAAGWPWTAMTCGLSCFFASGILDFGSLSFIFYDKNGFVCFLLLLWLYF